MLKMAGFILANDFQIAKFSYMYFAIVMIITYTCT